MKSIAEKEILFFLTKYCLLLIRSQRSVSLAAQKGNVSVRSLKAKTPNDQTSTFEVYACFLQISGAMKIGVPSLLSMVSLQTLANPKSQIFTSNLSTSKSTSLIDFSPSSGKLKSMLSSFTSQWAMLFFSKYSNDFKTYLKTFYNAYSEVFDCTLVLLKKSLIVPPLQYSINR